MVIGVPVSVIAAIAAVSVWMSGPSASALQVAERLMFTESLSVFIRTAESPRRDDRLDWSSDGCSAPVIESTGRSFDFTEACRRHDCGYRNIGKLENGRRWTTAMRSRVDEVFRRDMRAHCAKRTTVARVACRTWAEVYYRVVRAQGGP
ncbi:MAG: phospholipase A2 [Actinomycetota bacterium]